MHHMHDTATTSHRSCAILLGARSVLWGTVRDVAPATVLLMLALVSMVIVGTIDAVLYVRLAHKMDGYQWFLSQIAMTVAFCMISWPVVWYRMYSGTITSEMRSFPLRVFVWIGLLLSLIHR